RVLAEIPPPACKINIFQWNNKYLIKIEDGALEQTYKIDMTDVLDEKELYQVIDEAFIQECLKNFQSMELLLRSTIAKL
ncbi:MAG TPA: hypothetical protein PKC24_10015, partial [Cyclobacteriaceae bacterium]|nr:hypothetical protein [Cyclobacteriaceae bacterium]